MTKTLFSCSAARAALAFLLSLSLTNLTAGAQPYPAAQPGSRRAAQTAAATTAGTASLNFPPVQGDAPAEQCDQLADAPIDPQRVGKGVSFQYIQVDQALSACQSAAASQPPRPRYEYLYGRVLVAAQRYPEAIAQYTAADSAGYALASFGLARLYRDGLGVTRDWNEAIRFYSRAGNGGIGDAFANGGMLFAEENPPNYSQAKSWFEGAVQGGSGNGYAYLGWLYENGFGVNKDYTMALTLFNEAAKRYSADGMYRLGVAYDYGLGVTKDPVTACQWFIRAGSYSHPYGEEQAGFCNYNGISVPQSHAIAYNWFVDAGQAGLVDAQVLVADMLDRGDGPAKDPATAVQWYQAAAQQGNLYAMTELGAHLRLGQGVAWSEAQAMQWFAKAAQQGYVPAETSLAIGYLNGLGQDAGQGKQDYQQAATWFGKAAAQGDGYAQLNLGVMYENGWGFPQDLNRAKQLYAQAAASSDTQVAGLGKQYFDSVPASAPAGQTPQRTVASSSTDSTNFWTVVIVGALAIGAVSMLTSGGSSDSSGSTSGPSTCCASTSTGVTWPSSSTSSNPPGWTGDTAPFNPHYTDADSSRMNQIPMGDLTDPNIAWQ